MTLSPLQYTVRHTQTDFWNDSCATEELQYAIEHGAVGATSNPAIVLDVLKKEMPLWKERILDFARAFPTESEAETAWRLIEAMAVKGAGLLAPTFEREKGKKGRLSIQTDPSLWRNSKALVKQAQHFDSLAPNLMVKIPATSAGLVAMEEATSLGININATVSFTVPQVLAVAEAVERGLARRKKDGHDILNMTPVVTLMVGRLDDWMQVLSERDGVVANPEAIAWAGIACFKKAFQIFKQRGYQARLLAAAYRHQFHWTQLTGEGVILTIPSAWQKRFNASGLQVSSAIETPVKEAYVEELLKYFPDFKAAYNEKGLSPEQFDTFGPTRRTLRAFLKSYQDLLATVREVVLPNPDVK